MQVLNAELDNHETPGRFEALGSIAKHLPLGLDTHANERISGFHRERNIALGAVFGLRQVGNASLQVDVVPRQVQDLSLTHCGLKGDNDDREERQILVVVTVAKNQPLLTRSQAPIAPRGRGGLPYILDRVVTADTPLDAADIEIVGEQ